MKYLDGNYHVEVKDHRYRHHPTESFILRKKDPPTSLGTQCQVQNETQIRQNQKVIESNGKLEVKKYPKNKKNNQVNNNQNLIHLIVQPVNKING